jgi:hypothetical protein
MRSYGALYNLKMSASECRRSKGMGTGQALAQASFFLLRTGLAYMRKR